MYNKKRFHIIPNVGIEDDLTGDILTNNRSICKIMNQLSDKSNRLVEEYYKYLIVLKKYGIDSPEKLDQILLNQRVW